MGQQFILEAIGVTKNFGSVRALDDVGFTLKEGEVHALVGANGSGKSTLINILSGNLKPDAGMLRLYGEKVEFNTPIDSIGSGIACVHQEIDVAKDLTVADNIFLGNTKRFEKVGFIDHKSMNKAAKEILDSLGLNIDEKSTISGISFSEMQMIMVANALAKNARIIIFDEPTSSLSKKEIEYLFSKIETLRKQGISIIYISHHFDEVFSLGDRVSVLRDGKCVGTVDISEVDKDKLVHMMIGRKLDVHTKGECCLSGEVILRVEDLYTEDRRVNGVSLEVAKGKVIGFYGIVGAGRTEMAKAIFTGDNILSGKIFIDGLETKIKSIRQSMKKGIIYSSESRKTEGLLLNMSVIKNMSIAVIDQISKFMFINRKSENKLADYYIKELGIKVSGKNVPVGTLSGGNQQKVVISRWFATDSRVMIFDEPTVGVDVAAKIDIMRIISNSAKQGKAIIVISSELEELFMVCDEIKVMRMGKVEKTFYPNEYNQQNILMAAIGGLKNE